MSETVLNSVAHLDHWREREVKSLKSIFLNTMEEKDLNGLRWLLETPVLYQGSELTTFFTTLIILKSFMTETGISVRSGA